MPLVNTAESYCTVCKEAAVARGLCNKHYKRFMIHGHTKHTRPDTWGKTEKHPLYNSWGSAKKYGVCEEWIDFWKFVEDVGERPEGCALRRIDKKKPFSKENVFWKPMAASKDRAEYARKWRKANPLKVFESTLKKYYGITYADYMEMYDKQKGCCAVCGVGGYLVVDHCHTSGKVRGLLCSQCNTSLGLLREDTKIMESLIKYVKGA